MKPKVAYVCVWDAGDPNADSGYAYSMRQQLQKRFDIVDLFPLGLPGERLWQPVRVGYKMRGRYYHPMREPSILKRLARTVETELKSIRPDAVFAPSSVPVTFAETRWRWIYATDQLFCDFVQSYIKRPAARFLRLGEAQEVRSLETAARVTYASDCAARTAIAHYGANEGKIEVIPWGANLPAEFSDEQIAHAISCRAQETCRLVFIGRDWNRKGGDRFVATVHALNALGLHTHGIIIGADPPGLCPLRFTIYPHLDKVVSEDFAIFANALMHAHFLVAPARAEAYGQALCEAFAFGVPVIACAVGGIPTIVRDGENGILLPADASSDAFAHTIRDMLGSPQRYRKMAQAARDDYRARLNWNSFGARLNDAIAAMI